MAWFYVIFLTYISLASTGRKTKQHTDTEHEQEAMCFRHKLLYFLFFL